MRLFIFCMFNVLVVGLCAGGCSSGESGPYIPLDGQTQADGGVLPEECSIEGETRCDSTGSKLETCIRDGSGRLSWGTPVPCQGGVCQSGMCVDPCFGVTCTSPPGECHETTGTCWNGECMYDLVTDGTYCDDGDTCTENDQCRGGGCKGEQMVCMQPPADQCKDASTLTVRTSPGVCQNGACTYGTVDVPCPSGCDQAQGACVGDPCKNVTCDQPPTECHENIGTCMGGKCVYSFAEGKACDDGDACTDGDTCTAGKCQGTNKVCESPPPNECKDSTTLLTHALQGTCNAGQCAYTVDEVVCPHGCDDLTNSCTGDPCGGLVCDNPPGNCYKTDGICVNGSCSYDPDDGKPCDDGNACTDKDACLSGKCTGEPKACDQPPANTCKDASTLVVYTAPGFCQLGQCTYSSAEVQCGFGCDSDLGVCQGDPCASVTCDSPPNDQCYTVPGICSKGTCTYLPKLGVACDDGNPCTKNDTCDFTSSCEGEAYSCSDGLICTVDTCNGKGGCTNEVDDQSCLLRIGDDDTCVQGGALNTSNACQYCDPSQSQSRWSTAQGTEVKGWNFDDGTLQGFVITPAPPTSPVRWQVDSQRAHSGQHSLYFGDVSTHTFDDPGNAVSGAATSPDVALPTGKGKLCVAFRMFKDTEESGIFDQLSLAAVQPSAEQIVWNASDDVMYGQHDGDFISFAADLSQFAGSTVKLKLLFDSVDSIFNDTEGIYIDTIRVLTGCTP